MSINSKILNFRKPFFIGPILIIFLFMLIPLPSSLFKQDYSRVVLDRQGRLLRVYLNKAQQWQLPDDGRPVPEKLKQAVLQFEDRYFYYHPGVNPVAVFRALFQNLRSGRVVSGASTITMQVARLMRPKKRSYFNKILETAQALKMELFYSKEEILGIYLDHAPYGGNIIGYRAAALRYFRKQPDQLTWAETAVLAVLPNAPGLISPQVNPDLLKQKRDRLLDRLQEAKVISAETRRLAGLEEIPRQSYPVPVSAAHLCDWLVYQRTNQVLLRTTIDGDLQDRIYAQVQRHMAGLQSYGILNAAVVVADTRSGAVRAYIGSQDEQRVRVDGVQAPRSSGSILKPFLYALSMDAGIILPQTLLRDIPTWFGAFSPANADESWRGVVRAREALVRSLNVPAVRLLNTYGLNGFYDFLKSAGLRTLFRAADDYGLPLILGGAEVRLWEMAALYRGLARGGRFAPLHVLQDQQHAGQEKGLVSPAAAYLTLQMLKEVRRPGAENYWQMFNDQRPLAWKTGTSYGQRDAWAIGVNPQWTIAVWVGNFDGRGNGRLSGAASAGPLLFDIFNALPNDQGSDWFDPPREAFGMAKLCRASGYTAGPDCPQMELAAAPRGMKPLPVCPWHKRIFVSSDEGEEVCSLCWGDIEHKSVVRFLLPVEVSYYLNRNGYSSDQVPPHRKDCPSVSIARSLKITYPQNNAALWIPRDIDGRLQQINLRVASAGGGQPVFWYLDSKYLGSSRLRHEQAVTLSRGWHELEVIDSGGKSDRVRFYANLSGNPAR